MRKKILYIVNIDKFFLSHRKDIALKAKSLFKVHLATKFDLDKRIFKKKNILVHGLNIDRSSFGLMSNLITMLHIFKIIFKVKPDVIHFISIKPVLIGGVISRLFPTISKVLNLGILPNMVLSVLGIAILILSPTETFICLAKESPIKISSFGLVIKRPLIIELDK